MSDDKRSRYDEKKGKRNKKGKEDDKTLKTLIALAGFAIGATSIVAWNNRKNIQDKAQDAKERAVELKQKTIELTETVKEKLVQMQERKNESSLEIKSTSQESNKEHEPHITKSSSTDATNEELLNESSNKQLFATFVKSKSEKLEDSSDLKNPEDNE